MFDPNKRLREDIRLLGDLLGQTIKVQAGQDVFDKIEIIRKLAKKAQADPKPTLALLSHYLKNLSEDDLLNITRAFTQFLNLSNLAEQYHRIRRQRWYQSMPEAQVQPGSLSHMLPKLINQGITKEALFQAVGDLKIDLVLTAHPTEVIRRTLMYKYDQITSHLEQLDNTYLTPYEKTILIENLGAEITSAWLTEDARRVKPTPIEEAKSGLSVIEHSLWTAIPYFLRELDHVLLTETGQRLPLNAAPFRFGSWMGGDADGNPNVDADVTEEVTKLARWMACELYGRELDLLKLELSMNDCSPSLRSNVGDVAEPYRVLLRQLEKKMFALKVGIGQCIKEKTPLTIPVLQASEILEPLMLCYRSLHEQGAAIIANGRLRDTIWRVACFGATLVRLDIRQEASKHSLVIEEVIQFLNLGNYTHWSESEKQTFLVEKINDVMTFFPKDMPWSKTAESVFMTFQRLAQLPPDSLGAYIISQASKPSDVLLVALLQKEAEIVHRLRIVPLFETLDALNMASTCMKSLFSIQSYKASLQGEQEVMLGYSDSAKDGGFFAAAWAQYRAQEGLISVARSFDIQLNLFHGRGGSIGRGGWPTHVAIRAQPPQAIQGKFRVTEQGEVIRNKFGLAKIAERTLSIYTTATLEALLVPPPGPNPIFYTWMEKLSESSRVAYQSYVKNNQAFVEYFRLATPIDAFDRLTIGSRPARRRTHFDLENLRAIPWVFAWTQNRLLLSAWLGVYQALSPLEKGPSAIDIQHMAQIWPFFYSVLSMVEMVLAKADLDIAEQYDAALVPPPLLTQGQVFRELFRKTHHAILTVLNRDKLLDKDPILGRSIQVRKPYVLPLNLLQIELLSRTRKMDLASISDTHLSQALMVSINGIAAGMRNTG